MYVHLHRHSEYSLLDGTGTAEQYARRASELGQGALALTDHGTMSGALHHIVACEQQGIKPIVGMEAYWRSSRSVPMGKGDKRFHLVLLAKNQIGFHNLMRMSSEAYRSGMSGYTGVKRPCVDWELLSKYREGVIASTACLSSPLSRLIMLGSSKAEAWLKKLISIFGSDVLIEIMPGNSDAQRSLNVELARVAQQMSVPVVATVDAHYPYKDWVDTQDVLLMVNTGQSLLQRKAKRDSGEDVYSMRDSLDLYLMSEAEVAEAFAKHHPALPQAFVAEAIKNTSLIADRCDLVSVSKDNKLPRVKSDDPKLVVRSWCIEGLRRIGKSGDQAYEDRLKYEFGVLEHHDVVDYFYIIGDMVREMRKRGIRIGAGRGSAAGCLVSYLIGITSVDPIAHGLIFERFLNPGRKTLPDIDIDFQHDRRQEVIGYLRRKWGADQVVGVAAYQRFGAKAAISEVARVFDIPFADVKRVTKSLPEDGGKLVDLRQISPILDAFANSFPIVWKHACRLEGQVKAQSKHPAGVVVTDGPVEDYMPLCKSKDDEMVTAWSEAMDFRVITDYGFLKIDVLATDSLTVQARTLDLIEQRHGIRPDLDALPFMMDPNGASEDLLDALSKGKTLGVFQFNTKPLTQLLRQIKPKSFQDLAAANALIRPGPAQGGMAKSYAERLNGREAVSYWHSALQPALESTYGLMTYQEQVMEVVKHIAGFTMAEADDVRRAVSKKDPEKMGSIKSAFISGAVNAGMDNALAEDIWEKIVHFSGYAFNLSHAVGYAAQAAQDIWLKVNYPLEFYAALATYEPDQLSSIVREARTFGIKILPPDVNVSESGCTIVNDAIVLGLSSIKFVGDVAAQEIISLRPFSDYNEFVDKVPARKANARVKDALLSSGAFDSIGGRAGWSDQAKAEKENEFLGVPLSVESLVEKHHSIIAERSLPEMAFDAAEDGATVMVGGEITGVKQISTKKGDRMGFVDLAFGSDQFSVTVFPAEWLKYNSIFEQGGAILVLGRKDASREVVICDQAIEISDLAMQLTWKAEF